MKNINSPTFEGTLELISEFIEAHNVKEVPISDEEYFKSIINYRDNSSPEVEYGKNILVHLSPTKEKRDAFRNDIGISLIVDTDKNIEKIKTKVGIKKWNEIYKHSLKFYSEYETVINDSKTLFSDARKQKDLCEKLSKSLRKTKSSIYNNQFLSPFHGLIAKHTLDHDLLSAISSLQHSYTEDEATDIVMRIYTKSLLTSPSEILTLILDDLAVILDKQFINQESLMLIDKFSHGKISFKGYVMRHVFDLLYTEWPKKWGPNNETALISNLILGLKGSKKIIANDVANMNKKTRANYYYDK